MALEETNSSTSKVLNINIGLLGHVDSGKTSLAKCLSEICSTACFDKHPQSQERGITIDLGFSSFSLISPTKILMKGFKRIQYTLVDCPGHASLIRTIIGGINIIDLVILVIDIGKGIQTQTSECLVISQIAKKPLMIALNKIDLIESNKREEFIKKVMKKIEKALLNTQFKGAPIIPVVAKENYSDNRGIDMLIETLSEITYVPERSLNKPLVLSVDHCFSIKGKGTILTGTVLQGVIRVNDIIEIPAIKETKKVKSIQMFKKDVFSAVQGDRIGISVKQFEPSQIERALVCSPGYIPISYGAITSFNKVEYYKGDISSNAKYHISIGYETLMGKLTLFSSDNTEAFNINNEYPYREKYIDEEVKYYALLEFEKCVFIPPNTNTIIIGSKLDVNVNLHTCRLAFYGNILHCINNKKYKTSFLPNLKLYVVKEKIGLVQNVINENEVIVHRLFKNNSSLQKFIDFKVSLTTGESGYITGSFGQKDKVRIRIPEGLSSTTFALLSLHNKQKKGKFQTEVTSVTSNNKNETVKVILQFKKYIFDQKKNVIEPYVV